MTPRRVLYVLRYYPTLSETFVYREISELLRRGVSVTVLALGERVDGRLQDERPEVPVWRPTRGVAGLGSLPRAIRGAIRPEAVAALRWFSAQGHPMRDVMRVAAFAEQARLAGVDRVHAHFLGEASEWGWVIARLAGAVFSATAHAVDIYRPRKSLSALAAAARPLVAISEAGAAALRASGGNPVVIPCGVPIPPTPVHVDGDGPLRAICVARPVAKKGLDELVSAVLRADGAVRLRLVADVTQPAGPVVVGALSPRAVVDALAAAQVFVLPCRVADDGDRDGIPVALLEAMAAGLPVITTRVGGIPEVVDDAVGWLIDPEDPQALNQALREAQNPVERRRRGAEARRRILADRRTVARQVDDLLRAWS